MGKTKWTKRKTGGSGTDWMSRSDLAGGGGQIARN